MAQTNQYYGAFNGALTGSASYATQATQDQHGNAIDLWSSEFETLGFWTFSELNPSGTLNMATSTGTISFNTNGNFSATSFTGNGSGLTNLAASSLVYLTNKVLIAQTTTNAIFQYTVPAGVTNTYMIGGSLNVTAITTDVIKMSVLFTDENNVAQNDSLAASFSGTGFNSIASQSIRAKGGTVITVTTYLTTSIGSQTFDVNAFLSSVQ